MILATINPWLALYICLGAFLIACAWTAITVPLGILVGRMFRDRRVADQQAAADHGEPSRAQIEMTWDDLALGRVLAALDETDETYLFDAPEFAPPAAQRIREQIRANHDAEVERFRRELDGYGHGGAA